MINEWLDNKSRMAMTVFAVAAGNFLLARAWFELPTLDSSAVAQESEWRVELPAESNLQGFHIILSASSPWGRAASTSVATPSSASGEALTTSTENDPNQENASVLPETKLNGAFKGVVQVGRERYILLSDTQEGKMTAYRESDTLPDGSKVVAIGADYFTLRAQAEDIKLIKLYKTVTQ
ncbi:hypothetical protein [Thioflexithrix psekupsensis]|uniref:Type II secretion system protein GspC N-terminal domain-containing protein n=1 Tax=Thioflexithrix psekupsensis TaxID=1570016 RepID=A0A251XAS1_9GAMM|nr:hypothetical protein [Thioflexithrix psekupsensis]OUD15434.1 hypothetical protein TPSD3_02590 [Thioflexithrix psekupsensis]